MRWKPEFRHEWCCYGGEDQYEGMGKEMSPTRREQNPSLVFRKFIHRYADLCLEMLGGDGKAGVLKVSQRTQVLSIAKKLYPE